MGYHRVDPDSLAPSDDYPCDRRGVSDAADCSVLHLARYELAPGERLPRSYHYHAQREEAFYVLRGRLHVETPEGEYEVPAGEVFVAEPDSPHRAYNPDDADEPVAVVGAGAPRTDPALEYDPDGATESERDGGD